MLNSNMEWIHRGIRLSGDFEGRRDADISFKFRFCDDETYYYCVEQGGMWRLAHRGRFKIRSGRGRGPQATHVVRLEPCVVDVEPTNRVAYAELRERGLPAKSPEEYNLSVYRYDNAINPDRKLYGYIFCIPDPKGFSTRDWMLEPVDLSD